MGDHKNIYLGFDPGGDRRFGVALLDGDRVTSSTVSSVFDAMNWATNACGSQVPSGAGIDTLLHWAVTKSEMRPCDLQLRSMCPRALKSIMAPNSLFGAMAIGGMALATRLRQVWPSIELNETHPKVLLHALGVERYQPETVDAAIQWFIGRARCVDWVIQGEHALDAALSAWATREGFEGNWIDIIGEDANLPSLLDQCDIFGPQVPTVARSPNAGGGLL